MKSPDQHRRVQKTGPRNSPARRHAEEQLRQSKKRYRRLVELSPLPFAIICQDKWVYLNAAGLKLFGATGKEEIIGRPVLDFVHPDCQEILKGRLEQVLKKEKEPPITEIKMLHLDGQVIDVEIGALPIIFHSNPASQVVLRDITERKRYQQELEEREAFLASIFTSILDGLAVLDKEFNIIRANPTLEKWYPQFTPLVGKKCYQVYKGLDRPCQPCTCYTTAQRGETGFTVTAKKDARGNVTGWLEHYNYPLVEMTTNRVKGLIIASRDITEKLQVEREMARLESLNLVGEMAAGIGHEVRNPMTTVRGFLQLFKSRHQCQEFEEYFDLMIQELDRANSIISEFLSLAKNRTIDLTMQNLNSIIQTLYPLMQANARVSEKNVQLNLECLPDFPLNEKEIRQLILNLVRNGLEAMPPGKTLTISTFTKDTEVVLAVQDHGKGIEPDLLGKLGTPFLTTKEQGTGLGLAVCYSIAARHKAAIEVETGPTGTTFYVKFKR